MAAPALLAASLAGAAVFTMMDEAGPVERAAARSIELVGLYPRLYDSDLTETVFPIAQGVAGRAASGQAVVCGLVVSGVDAADPGGVRAVRWQRSYGACAASRIGRVDGAAAMPEGRLAPDGAPVVVVEVVSHAAADPSGAARYAASVAVPQKGVLPTIVAGSRY